MNAAAVRGSVPPRAYAWLVLGLGLLVTVLIGSANGLVDPYDWFDLDLAWLNGKKNVAYMQDRIFKVRDVSRLRPVVSVLGTSRLGMGMHHSHPALGPTAYNLGLTGAGIYECRRNLQHLQAVQPQRRVVLGLDFEQFDHQARPSPLFREDRLRTDPQGGAQPGSRWADLPAILWSADACRDSWSTVRQTRDPHRRALAYDRGTFEEQAMREWIANEIPLPLRSLIANGFEWAFLRLLNDFTLKYLDFSYLDDTGRSPLIDEVAIILDLARREGIDLHLFITPIHARLGQVYHITGHWDEFRRWKRDLAAVVAAEATRSGAAPFPLWDFATWSAVTRELPPPQTATGVEPRWYWEASHFRRELGALVLDRMFGTTAAPIPVPEDFGTRLNGADLDAHLALVDRRREEWAATDGFGVKIIQVFYDVIRHNRYGTPLAPEYQAMAEKMRQMLEPATGDGLRK
jgi:hypothetical protein